MKRGELALMVAHPAHILTITGIVQQYEPDILIWTKSLSPAGKSQATVVRAGLKILGMLDRATFLDVDEADSYQWAHQGRLAPFLALRDRMQQWLLEVQPRAVIGDGFECSNFQHDVGRLALDSALRGYSAATGCEVCNYEIPLACRVDDDPAAVKYQTFPQGGHTSYELTEAELEKKRKLIQWAWPQSEFIAEVAPLFPPIDSEPYRRVPADRDYSQPPEGLQKHYDSRGREMVRRGIHQKPILFDAHFLPIANALQADASVGEAGAPRR